ncbi:MAG: hypothetical protein LBN43_04570 [Oscillospiraceae bacterium]|jgi:hypothetical protein|nr:hypothetical protein [Oscillospiraceae bacterium]
MKKKKGCGLIKFVGIIGLILAAVSLIAAIISHWDELREIFPWLPDVKTDFDPDYDDYDDFADL